ncbi:hypothetical protein NP493_383g04075 [Ridgeia piscesae]|uniref:Ubiquitin-like domain-containing protein n=1 Tax=Ridgeia piscesae TaxID=27915 RepID=A0AAD9L1P9_RIDPI|nr:hypothetical protein NP493_383g04075 [Ridgeia piscesae]
MADSDDDMSDVASDQIPVMRIFVVYGQERISVDVYDAQTVHDVKENVRELLNMGPDEGPTGVEVQEKKILTLTYAGSELENSWVFGDIGITPLSTVKAVLREEVKPSLYIYSAFNDDMVPLLDKINFSTLTVSDFRALISRKVGLPVGVFRLLSEKGAEMFDFHTLYDYGVVLGSTVRLDTWDGWNDFLNLAVMGFSSHVMANLMADDAVAKYQMKVAMYMAAHFGHVDLAVSLLRCNVRADEPTGYHPIRLWCRDAVQHIDAVKTPIHEAAEAGQLGVLRTFVNNNIATVLARDGYGLTPLNIALRRRQKPCASFLLTKQWSKVPYTRKASIPLSVYVRMRQWSDAARDKVFTLHGQWKSSLRATRRGGTTGALVSYGVQLDGFTATRLTSKPMAQLRAEEEPEQRRLKRGQMALLSSSRNDLNDPETYFRGLALGSSFKLPRLSRFSRASRSIIQGHRLMVEQERMATEPSEADSSENDNDGTSSKSSSPDMRRRSRMAANSVTESQFQFRLPPIQEKLRQSSRNASISHQNLTTGNKSEPEFERTRQFFMRTGQREAPAAVRHTPTPSPIKNSTSSPSLPDSTPSVKKSTKTKARKLPKRGRVPRSAVALAKTKSTDGANQLPVACLEAVPRPFASDTLGAMTLRSYEQYRGLKSRDYAMKCLLVANRFREKPWLTQVQQAMTIAARGVRKTVNGKPHLFSQYAHPRGAGPPGRTETAVEGL